jgi:hypothetical protein
MFMDYSSVCVLRHELGDALLLAMKELGVDDDDEVDVMDSQVTMKIKFLTI